MSANEIKALGGPSAAGIPAGLSVPLTVTASLQAPRSLSWSRCRSVPGAKSDQPDQSSVAERRRSDDQYADHGAGQRRHGVLSRCQPVTGASRPQLDGLTVGISMNLDSERGLQGCRTIGIVTLQPEGCVPIANPVHGHSARHKTVASQQRTSAGDRFVSLNRRHRVSAQRFDESGVSPVPASHRSPRTGALCRTPRRADRVMECGG